MTESNKVTRERILISFTIVFCLWGWILQQTVYSNVLLVYASFLAILAVSIICIIQCISSFRAVDKYVFLWLPYLVYTMLSVLSQGDIERFSYWFVCATLILVAQNVEISNCISYKVFGISGFVCILGIWIQILFPDFYNTHIADIFVNAQMIKNWANWRYGYTGFTCQIGMTSIILIYFEAYLLYIKWDKSRRNVASYIVLIFIIVSIFLTGKRMMSLLAVVAPLVVYVLSEKSINRKRRNVFIGVILALLAIGIFYTNLEALTNSDVFGRMARTILAFQSGEDISTNRSELSTLAIAVFQEHPVFGVGVSQYKAASGAYTDVHNAFLQVLCEQGVFGIILLILPMIMCYMRTISVMKSFSVTADIAPLKFSLCIQTIFIMYSFTGNTLADRHCFIVYFLAIAIMCDYINRLYTEWGECR